MAKIICIRTRIVLYNPLDYKVELCNPVTFEYVETIYIKANDETDAENEALNQAYLKKLMVKGMPQKVAS